MMYGVEYHAVLYYSSSRFIFNSIFLASMLAAICNASNVFAPINYWCKLCSIICVNFVKCPRSC